MGDLGNKEVMAANIQKFMSLRDITKADLSRILHVPYSTVSDWVNGKTYPRIDKVEMMANYFGISKAELVERKVESTHVGQLPLFGSVCAGDGIFADDFIEEWIDVGLGAYSQSTHFMLRIKGDSMEPRLEDGDIVIVKKQETANNGDIVIALVNGDEGVCKQFRKYGERGVALVSLNPSYEPRFFSEEEVSGIPVRIIGKVVELKRSF